MMDAAKRSSDDYQDTESEVHLAQETNSVLFQSRKELTVVSKQKQQETVDLVPLKPCQRLVRGFSSTNTP